MCVYVRFIFNTNTEYRIILVSSVTSNLNYHYLLGNCHHSTFIKVKHEVCSTIFNEQNLVLGLVHVGIWVLTVEIFLIWTNVTRTNVIVNVGICSRCY